MKPLRLLLSALFRRNRMESDMADELSFHLERRADDLVGRGLSRPDAIRRARLEFGGVDAHKENCREAFGLRWFDEARADLRYTRRSLRASKGFALSTVLSLAIGIGVNISCFAWLDSIVLHAFPYPQAERVVMMAETNVKDETRQDPVAPANFYDWKEASGSLERLTAYQSWDAMLTSGGDPERVSAVRVTADFFAAFAMRPEVGRDFRPQEYEPGSERVAVVSHGFWLSRMAGVAQPLGRTIAIDRRDYVVVGVMSDDFDFPLAAEVWTPLALSPARKARRNAGELAVIGRLKAGISVERARAEMAAIAATLEQRYPRSNEGRGVWLQPLGKMNEITDRFIVILVCAAGFVLLLACANIGSLQLARFTVRRREMGLRAALGASRFRLVRQLLTESIVISVAGSVLGAGLGWWSLGVLRATVPAEVLRWVAGMRHVRLEPVDLVYGFALSLAAGVMCGLPSIYQLIRQGCSHGPNESLKEAGRGTTASRAGNGARAVLVATEVALAVVLVVGAGLMVRSFQRMLAVNSGIDPQGVLTMEVTPSSANYRDLAQMSGFYDRALRELDTVPGVEAAALSGGVNGAMWEIEGRPALVTADARPDPRSISPRYFHSMRIPIVEGRAIGEQDGADSPRVVVLSQTLARHYWPGASPIGQRVRLGTADSPWLTVVGVCGDVRDWFTSEPESLAYLSYRQAIPTVVRFALRTAGVPAQLARAARLAVGRADAAQLVYNVKTMEQILYEESSGVRASVRMMSAYAGIALILALMGSYSVASFFVSQRTQEIGVRVALGASPAGILRMVLLQVGRVTSIGLMAGFVAALALSFLLSRVLYGVVAVEPAIVIGLTALLGASALLATYVPAYRASRVDPVVALRNE